MTTKTIAQVNSETQIGNPIVWLIGFLVMLGSAGIAAYIFFDVIETLVRFGTHGRG